MGTLPRNQEIRTLCPKEEKLFFFNRLHILSTLLHEIYISHGVGPLTVVGYSADCSAFAFGVLGSLTKKRTLSMSQI